MGHVLCARGAVQHEAAHALHCGMWLWMVDRDAFLPGLIAVVGGPRRKVGTRACERGEVLATIVVVVFHHL
eukprot:11043806-Alexandrium_andersonii.AAC.1